MPLIWGTMSKINFDKSECSGSDTEFKLLSYKWQSIYQIQLLLASAVLPGPYTLHRVSHVQWQCSRTSHKAIFRFFRKLLVLVGMGCLNYASLPLIALPIKSIAPIHVRWSCVLALLRATPSTRHRPSRPWKEQLSLCSATAIALTTGFCSAPYADESIG